MKFRIKNTLEATYACEQSDNWEIYLRENQKEASLLFACKYVTSMSPESFYLIGKYIETGEIENVETIIINDWKVSFEMKQKNEYLYHTKPSAFNVGEKVS